MDLLIAADAGKLDSIEPPAWFNDPVANVVLAAKGYPGSYQKGLPIGGVDEANHGTATVFHAGTKLNEGQLVNSGGRVLAVSGRGDSLKSALDQAYAGIGKIGFDGAHYRKDIGASSLTS